MLIIHDLEPFQADWEACVLTLGVFDGLHRAHQSLLKEVQRHGNKRKRARVLLTYSPHPDFVLGKRSSFESNRELCTRQEKISLLEKFNLDAVCFLRFTPELARMRALAYLKKILLDKLRAVYIIIGYDQHFGRGRKGNYAFLKKMSFRYPFQVKRIPALKYRRELISSSNIREHIATGKIERANSLLGYSFFMQARVKRGEQRGRKLGFPTLNLETPLEKLVPPEGVYAGFANWDKRCFRAMISIGNKPSFTGSKNSKEKGKEIEAHLLDFNEKKELYGQNITLFFEKYLREQVKFNSAEELIIQLEKDELLVRASKRRGPLFP